MRPLRFGVVAESARTPDDLLCIAQLAEDAGCSTLLIRDHFIEGPFEHQLAPLTALTFVAAATSRLRIGRSSSTTTTGTRSCWRRSLPRWTCCPAAA